MKYSVDTQAKRVSRDLFKGESEDTFIGVITLDGDFTHAEIYPDYEITTKKASIVPAIPIQAPNTARPFVPWVARIEPAPMFPVFPGVWGVDSLDIRFLNQTL